MILARLILPCLLLALAACGFTPLHSAGGAGQGAGDARIALDPIEGRVGYFLERELDRMLIGAGGQPIYRLSVKVEEQRDQVGVRVDRTVRRQDVVLTASWTLSGLDGKPVASGSEVATASFDLPNDPYATITAKEDAQVRAAEALALRLRAATLASLAQRKGT